MRRTLPTTPAPLATPPSHLVERWRTLHVDRVFEPESSLALVRGLILRGGAAEEGERDVRARCTSGTALFNTAPLSASFSKSSSPPAKTDVWAASRKTSGPDVCAPSP